MDGTSLCLWSHGLLSKAWYEMGESITWNLVRKTMGPTLRTSCMLLIVCSWIPVKLETSIGAPTILLSGILAALSVLGGTRLSDALVSTSALLMWTSLIWAATYNGLLWLGCFTSISSSMKVMALVVFRKARLAWASAVRQCVPKLAAMDTKASVAILLDFFLSPNWLNKVRKVGLL